ncbi:MAG: hypothetical protein KME21_08170 [Desmonostoc vinosum HA7617-LM4]|jgi:hypothetical protein|nr:hypothetical protein [Desmonostoc vinosum HA7617-LM4]
MSQSTANKSNTSQIKSVVVTQEITPMYPRLACQVNFYQGQMIFSQNGRFLAFEFNEQSRERLQKLFSMMDGSHSLSELQQKVFPHNPEVINGIIQSLDKQGFIDDLAHLKINSSTEAILDLEDLANKLLDQNPFCQASNLLTSNLSTNILYGFAIEHYYLLSHYYYFYSPILNFQGSTKVQALIKELYYQEQGQDEFLLSALNTIGISREQLIESMPLTETMAMCNGLMYWANFDSLFLLSILGVLTQKKLKTFESYLHFCKQAELDSSFIQSIQKLLTTKLNHESESLTRRIFQEITHVDESTKQRLARQTHLFGEIYHNFYQAIWNHYTRTNNLLRHIAII